MGLVTDHLLDSVLLLDTTGH